MRKYILVLASFIFMVGCASQQKAAHHHHEPEFEGKCAYSVSHGNHEVAGKPEFKVDYKNKTYYFSDAAMRDHFIGEIKGNIQKANNKWKEFRGPGGAADR